MKALCPPAEEVRRNEKIPPVEKAGAVRLGAGRVGPQVSSAGARSPSRDRRRRADCACAIAPGSGQTRSAGRAEVCQPVSQPVRYPARLGLRRRPAVFGPKGGRGARHGDVRLSAAEEDLGGGPGQAAGEVHPADVPERRGGAGPVLPRGGGAQQAAPRRARPPAGQARGRARDAAEVGLGPGGGRPSAACCSPCFLLSSCVPPSHPLPGPAVLPLVAGRVGVVCIPSC